MRNFLLLLVFGALASGCVEEEQTADRFTHFYVSNQSFDQPEARIELRVDGHVVFDRLAPVENQHNWIPFDLALSNGTHELRALEKTSGATDTWTLEIPGERWIVVEYWTSPARFTHSVHEAQVAFT